MKLLIITPDATIFNDQITSVRVPGTKGSFQVLRDHAPIISTLDKGPVCVVDSNGDLFTWEISGGVIEVRTNNIVLLADSAHSHKPG